MKSLALITSTIMLSLAGQAAWAQSARSTFGVGIVITPAAVRSSQALAGNRLPFRTGLYARAGAACTGDTDVVGLSMDRITTGGGSCSIEAVRVQGRNVRFREVCWRGGEEIAIQRRWTRHSLSRFSTDGHTYERCRGTMTATR